MNWFTHYYEAFLNMTPEDRKVLVQTLAGVATIATFIFGTMWMQMRKLRARVDLSREIDGDDIVEENVIFSRDPDATPRVAIESQHGPIKTTAVFGNDSLVKDAGHFVRKNKSGEPLFPAGKKHYLAMERTCSHVTGNDPPASMSAMFGRTDDYEHDSVLVYLTSMRGEDGQQMAHILKANAADLAAMLDERYVKVLRGVRQVHSAYIPALIRMAHFAQEAKKLYDQNGDEREEGTHAFVWTALVRTQKSIGPEEVRRIIREELKAALGGESRTVSDDTLATRLSRVRVKT